MINSETPIDFSINKIIGNYRLVYSNLIEISQGGPEVGTISIDGKEISSYKFGGPILHDNKKLYIPFFIRKFCISGFRLCKINLETLNIEMIGDIKNLIYLDKIEGDKILFFEDMKRSKMSFYHLNDKK
ncbi:hypothetical protein [Pedobacter sp.]|uniref:hypothetical protein n=1 Tax=Pedobacter sp. TaxID=1411316 RepID=UPI00396C8BB6